MQLFSSEFFLTFFFQLSDASAHVFHFAISLIIRDGYHIINQDSWIDAIFSSRLLTSKPIEYVPSQQSETSCRQSIAASTSVVS